jgi:hypothetical protein
MKDRDFMRKMIVATVLALSACQTGPVVKKTVFSTSLDMNSDWVEPCIWVSKEKKLFCVTREEYAKMSLEEKLNSPVPLE